MRYLIIDYSDDAKEKNNGKEKEKVVSQKWLFEQLNDFRKDENFKIAVYEIGECILDWS